MIKGALRQVRSLGRGERVFLTAFFLAFSALALLFPRSGDDWAWATSEGVARLQNLFTDYNGRYVGNLLVLVLLRSGPVSQLVIAGVVTATLFLIADLAGNRTTPGYLLIATMFVGMPVGMWRQSIVWMSGFSNYAVATLLLLLILRAVKREITDVSVSAGWSVRALGWFGVLVICAGLIMEHVTLFLITASFAYVVFMRVQRKMWSPLGLQWLSSILFASGLMFSNGAYRAALNGQGAYQSVGAGAGADGTGLVSLLRRALDVLAMHSLVDNHLVVAFILASVLFLAIRALRRSRRGETGALLLVLGTLVAAGLVTWFGTAEHFSSRWAVSGLRGVAALLILVLPALAAWRLVEDHVIRWVVIATSMSMAMLTIPLVAVNPIGFRSFYPGYALLLVIAAALLGIVQQSLRRASLAAVTTAAALLVALAMASYGSVYLAIDSAQVDRLARIRAAVERGERTIVVPDLPFPDHVHQGNPSSMVLASRFKKYYALPSELVILTP